MSNITVPSCVTADIKTYFDYNYTSVCSFVETVCANETSTVNFFNFYYCDLNETPWTLIVIAVIFLILSFYLLSSTAEDYLEPVLTTIAVKLNFSDSLAGVTLVALANGAPDVFAAIAAGASPTAGILLPIGSLFGAGTFVTTVVLALCIINSKGGTLQVEAGPLTRDCLFYCCGAIWILCQGLFAKELGLIGAIGLFAIYGTFLSVVIFTEFRIKREEKKKNAELHEEQKRKPSFHIGIHSASASIEGDLPPEENKDDKLTSLIKDQHIAPTESSFSDERMLAINALEIKEGSFSSAADGSMSPRTLRRLGTHHPIVKARFQYVQLRRKFLDEYKEIREKTVMGKILAVLTFPFNLIRNLTIPVSTQDKYNKNLLIVQPVLTALFLLWQFGFWFDDVVPWVVFGIITVSISILFWKIARTSEVPQGALGLFLLVVSFVSGTVWINYIANIFVDFISLLSVFTGLPLNFLGLTLLAWGNSLNDMFVDTALAKKGLAQVAVSGVVAGQYFNLSIGFGVSLVIQYFSFGNGSFNLLLSDHINRVSLILICCLLLSLVSTLIYGFFTKYHLKKFYGIYLVTIYVAFFLTAVLLTIVFPN